MKLYHASDQEVKAPNTQFSRDFLDFGRGFYLTSIYEQAIKYAQRFTRRQKPAFINIYDFTENIGIWKVKIFKEYDDEWLDFVSACRSGNEVTNYDMVVGGIANDKVIITLDLYFDGTLSREETLGRLKFENPNIQYCIRTQQMIDECLTFNECVRL